jgi:GTP-binding protein
LEGAHEGHGLGHAFLRHISRCRVLLHLLDGTSPDPIGDYKAIQLELELFNPALLDKPQVCICVLAVSVTCPFCDRLDYGDAVLSK